MGFMDKIKNMIAVPEDDDDLYDDMGNELDFKQRDDDIYSSSAKSGDTKRNKDVNIHATTQLQVVLVKPESFQDSTSIADHLNDRRTVVLNLESTNREVSRRIVDFLSGVAYANQGTLKRVANSTFIITPFNVNIMGDLLLDELENSGVYI